MQGPRGARGDPDGGGLARPRPRGVVVATGARSPSTDAPGARPGGAAGAGRGSRAGGDSAARGGGQNEKRRASSIWREGALMFGASERSFSPKFDEFRLPIGASKLARSKAFSTWNTASTP